MVFIYTWFKKIKAKLIYLSLITLANHVMAFFPCFRSNGFFHSLWFLNPSWYRIIFIEDDDVLFMFNQHLHNFACVPVLMSTFCIKIWTYLSHSRLPQQPHGWAFPCCRNLHICVRADKHWVLRHLEIKSKQRWC